MTTHNDFDLAAAALQEMIHEGFDPDFAPGMEEQLAAIKTRPAAQSSNVRDLRDMLWSSIDNDSSRDLDQIEVAERVTNGIRVLVGIADVDADVPKNTPIDQHAASQTTTVYTGVKTFPMLPEELSTDLTSLNEDTDRLAIVIEMLVSADGKVSNTSAYRALVRNKAQLTYNATGAWLEGKGEAPPKVAASTDLQTQLKLQNEAATALRDQRHRSGALDFDREEAEPDVRDGKVQGIVAHHANLATKLIEDFMIAANGVVARGLTDAGVSSIRRVVKAPERWGRIVQLAAQFGARLPPEPDAEALGGFLQKRRAADEAHYPDLSLSIIKLMGPGEYVLLRAGAESEGHFALAVHDYTHSTAPNRRFADLVVQRLIKNSFDKKPQAYSDDELASIARNCTLKEDAARKVQRTMQKRIAAVALQGKIGQTFSGIVTGNTSKGVFVRIVNPPVEGRIVQGEQGADVGDRIQVRLINTDAQRGFIDFARAS